jgi:hypothetical protein
MWFELWTRACDNVRTQKGNAASLRYEGTKRVPATFSAIADALRWAEEIMRAIDERWHLAK